MTKEESRGGAAHHFHYDRAERLSSKGDEKTAEPKGLLRRNRSLTIIFLDIIIIVIMLVLFQFVFTPGRSSTRVGDFRAVLTSFLFESELYVTVEISRVRAGEVPMAGAESLVVVRFPGREDILDILPSAVDDRITVEAVFPTHELPRDATIAVDVVLLGDIVTLISTPKQ